jgi:hypothetical protein
VIAVLAFALACPDLSGVYRFGKLELEVAQVACDSVVMALRDGGASREVVRWDLNGRDWQGDCASQCVFAFVDRRGVHAQFRREAKLVRGGVQCQYYEQVFGMDASGDLSIDYEVICIDGFVGTLRDTFTRLR